MVARSKGRWVDVGTADQWDDSAVYARLSRERLCVCSWRHAGHIKSVFDMTGSGCNEIDAAWRTAAIILGPVAVCCGWVGAMVKRGAFETSG